MTVSTVPIFEVEYDGGPNCPVCGDKILMIANVQLDKVAVKVRKIDDFTNNMEAIVEAKVVNVSTEHTCTPGVPDAGR